jgi:hypothetical protein
MFTVPSEPDAVTIGPNYFEVPTTVRLAVGSRPLVVSEVQVAFFEAGAFSGLSINFVYYGLGFGALGLFTGAITDPTLASGTFQLAGGTLVVTPIPEPASSGYAMAGVILLLTLHAHRVRLRGLLE